MGRAPGIAIEEARGIEVAGPGGIDHLGHGLGVDHMDLLARQDDGTPRAAGQCRDLAMAAGRLQRLVEARHLPEGAQISASLAKRMSTWSRTRSRNSAAVAFDAEGIRQAERHLAAGVMGDLGRLEEGRLGRRRIPEIALEVGHLGADPTLVDILGPQLDAGAEIGIHGALRVGGDEDQAARGRGIGGGDGGLEGDAIGPDVVAEDAAQLVVADLADEGAAPAERGDPGHGVGGRAAGDLDPRAHGVVERRRPRGVDQGHGALDQSLFGQQVVIGIRQHVDDGVADSDDVEASRACELSPIA